ncbi:MAG: tetratricopeptide repeat protein [Leptolyngbyaceae cyanobacterium SM1_3_5]|nr:tetratricopeptide repeat protein [Leptolyngbyaceae cyanobacterium SM1_3_5]
MADCDCDDRQLDPVHARSGRGGGLAAPAANGDRAESPDALQAAQLHNHMGNTYAQLGNWERAKTHYQQSLQHLQDRQEPIREAQTIANLGLVYLQQNNLEAAAMQWGLALGRLPAGSVADRAMMQWMHSIDEALLLKAGSRVDRPAASNFLGAIGGIFKRIIS